jgi:glycosyltransferase involved in cell wall biosynthesis
MKLMIICDSWYEHSTGGLQVYVKNFLKIAKPIFEKIIVVVPSITNRKSVDKQDNIEVHKVPFIPMLGTKKKPTQKKSLKLFEYLDNLIRREKIDLVETQSITRIPSIFFAIFMAGIKNKIPVVERLHGIPHSPTWVSVLKDIGFAKIICVSKYLSEFVYRNGISAKKIISVYPGINTSHFAPSKKNYRGELGYKPNDVVILHASRIITIGDLAVETIETKGLTTLIKAFSIVSEKDSNVKLMIAAALPNKENMKYFDLAIRKIMNYAEIYGVSDKVKVMPVKYDDMPKAYNTCDIFVMLSKEETFGLVYAEAMSCEKPVIASSICAMPEIIVNNETGYLVSPEDPVEVSKRIHWLVDDKEKRIAFGKEGRKKIIEKFENGQIAIELKEAYENIVFNYKKING